MASVVNISVSPVRTEIVAGKRLTSGIFKRPVTGPIRVHTLGFEGDDQADKRHHGGPHQAVYMYPAAHYAAIAAEMQRDDLHLGKFGENIAVSELDETTVCIGDILRIGDASGIEVQATSPRLPCNTLAAAVGDPKIVKLFMETGRLGWYCRVLKEGSIRTGDTVTVIHRDPARFSIRRLGWLRGKDKDDVAGMKAAIAVEALHPEWRDKFIERIQELEQSPSARKRSH